MKQSYSGKMVKVMLITIAAIFLMSQMSFGIQLRKKHKQTNHTSKSFPYALSISVDNDVVDDSFGGISISALKQYSDNSAVRANISFGHAKRDYHIDDNLDYFDGEFLNNYDETDRYEIRLSVQHLTYPSYNKGFNFYWGAGPIVTLHYSATDYYELDYVNEWRETYQSISIGGIGTAGMELFLAPNFSVQAEYELTLQHEWSEYLDEDIYRDEPIYENFKFHDEHNYSTSQFKLGMSFHF